MAITKKTGTKTKANAKTKAKTKVSNVSDPVLKVMTAEAAVELAERWRARTSAAKEVKSRPTPIATYSSSPNDRVGRMSIEEEAELKSANDRAAFYKESADIKRELLSVLEEENRALRIRGNILQRALARHDIRMEESFAAYEDRLENDELVKDMSSLFDSSVFKSSLTDKRS